MAGEAARIPMLTARTDVRSLPLAPIDGYVLSRIDGKVNERELATLTGLSDDQVRASLEKLESLEVIAFPGATPKPATTEATREPSRAAPTPPPAAPRTSTPAAAPSGAPLPPSMAARHLKFTVPADSPELAEDVDLEPELRKRILGLHTALNNLDYYTVLGVTRSADKKSIKRAYFELASLFHPDKYFRKRLGSFKLKMEAIFGRVTQAYDALTSKEQRKEYDQYLVDLDQTRGIESMLEDALSEMRRAEDEARTAIDASAPLSLADPGRGAAESDATRPANKDGANPAAPAMSPAIADRARRDLLAMRLRGGQAQRPGARPGVGAIRTPSPTSADAVDALKRRFDDRVARARKEQAKKYLDLAAEAEKKNDIAGAANNYRVAATFSPDDADLKKLADEASSKAEVFLAETYQRQAHYEEREQHWAEAARSWSRVAKAKPNDAQSHERAANAIVKAGGDLHVAGNLAKRAVEIEPQNADYKITLANVYLSAGLALNAKRELEAAAQLSPRNDKITALLKRVHKAV